MTEPQHDPNLQTPSAKRHISKRTLFFGSCAVIAILVYCIANATSFEDVFARIGDVVSPLIIGCIIAYLCNPFLKFYEYVVFRKLGKGNLRLGLSLFATVLTFFGILAIIIALILPELIDSISQLITNYEFYLNGLLGFIQSVINKLPEEIAGHIDISDMQKFTSFLTDMFGAGEDIMSKVLSFLEGFLLDGKLIGDVWAFVMSVFNTFMDLILGLFIAFYILSSKEKRAAQIHKFRAACFSDKQNEKITEVVSLIDQTFGGFIKGVLLDAVAVGVVTFILLSICNISEYNLLIAAICAITNIIPVFGPFIGAIPSGLIVLISNPEKFILFIILVIIIQQIDGNLLCPMIQGNNTGVSSLAVLVAITVMGGFFGLGGMVIGVPVFAVIIELVKRSIENRLRKKNKSTDTTDYYAANAVGNAVEDVYYEHAHWKYKYDHSRVKPHVDKLIAAIRRIGKKDKTKSADVNTDSTTEDTEK
ncbi:MAG: AI-2E family transporter [Clostridia bacterium]|nr:AI-2E family transporter [Clostridia bacterium]